jgi:hypothetical protein
MLSGAPMKLYGRISALASDVGGFGADFKPTNQQVEVYDVFRKQLDDVQVPNIKNWSMRKSLYLTSF